jgi:hypothetical protein
MRARCASVGTTGSAASGVPSRPVSRAPTSGACETDAHGMSITTGSVRLNLNVPDLVVSGCTKNCNHPSLMG